MALFEVVKYDGPPPRPDAPAWLVWKFPSDSIVLGSQLIVNQGQEAVFFRGGAALDVFGPGTFTLSSANLPLLHKLINLPFGGKTPFAAEVYFVNKTAKLDMKWGTPDPIQVREPQFGVIVRAGAFGTFGIRIGDSRQFVTQLIGAIGPANMSDTNLVASYFRGLVASKIKDIIGDFVVNKQISLLDMAAHLDELATIARARISEEFDRFAIDVLNFFVESVNIREDDLAKLRRTLEEKAEFEVLGDDRYTRKRSFDVLESAAKTEGGAGSVLGAALGAGLGFGAATAASGPMAEVTRKLKLSPEANTVTCTKCGSGNPSTSKFCGQCGSALTLKACPNCGATSSPEMKFCGNCGTSLAAPGA